MIRRVGRYLDLNLVRPFQIVIYTGSVAAGAHGLVLGAPPNAVSASMGHSVALLWLAMLIVCPVVAFVGMVWRRTPQGAWLQIGGAMGISLTSGAYATAIFDATWSDRATYAAWMAVSLSICGLLVAMRDVRHWWLLTQLARHVGGGND